MSVRNDVAAARPLERSPVVRVAALTAGAFLVYGGWALFVNLAHGLPIAARAFVVQGASSALSTLLLSSAIEWMLVRTRHAARWLLAALVPPTLTAAMHLTGHLLNGTPRLGATVAVPIAMGYVFAALYVWSRRRHDRRGALANVVQV